MQAEIEKAVAAIRERYPAQPRLGLILGSGLGAFADSLKRKTVIPFAELPGFPRATVAGHAGNLVLGEAEGVTIAMLQGRVHFYEGYTMAEVVFPVRVLGRLGIRQLIVTNAAGGIRADLSPGDLMLISDHINLTGANPLIGPNLEDLGTRFPDMSEAYDGVMRRIAVRAARGQGIPLPSGVYACLAGPSYETPAEVRMLRTLGADAVGMSTVPEVIAACHMGIRVLGISCIANMAAGMLPGKLTHQDAIATTDRVKERMISLLCGVVPLLSSEIGSRG